MKITLVANGPLLIETPGEWNWTSDSGHTTGKDGLPCVVAVLRPASLSVTVRTGRRGSLPMVVRAS
jgi:hypothetical protein